MAFSFRTLLAQLWRQPQVRSSRRTSVRTRSFRPQLESLEHRVVPVLSIGGGTSISGQVFTDVTGNGLSADDTPQQGVQVVLLAPNQHRGYHEVAEVETGASGSYSFTGLTAGTYLVTERVPHDSVRTDPATSSYYQVTLATGQNVTGEDFANFHLLNTAAVKDLTFTIFDPATGKITTVRDLRDLRGHTREGDTVTANFSIHGNAPVVVSFVAYDAPGPGRNAAAASQLVMVSDSTGTFTKGKNSLTLQVPDNFYQIDLVVGPAINQFGPPCSNISYTAQHRLLGAANGGTQPAGSATVTGLVFYDNDGTGTFEAGDSVIDGAPVTIVNTATDSQESTTTSSGGTYSFTGLQAGTYTVTVTLPDSSTLSSSVTVTASGTSTDNFAAPPAAGGGGGLGA